MTQIDSSSPLVTIIVPTIGRPEYILDTLRSVLAQSYQNLQILISDNAPAAPTQPLLWAAGIVDQRIEFIAHPARLGFSAHMNACISMAKGTYLMILSDDDQITPHYVNDLVHLLEEDAEVKVGLGRQVQVDENDRGLIAKQVPVWPHKTIDGVEFLKGSLSGTLRTGMLTYISMFVRRDDILRVGGFRNYPDGSHADNFIVFTLSLLGKVAISSGPMYYRVYLSSFGLRTQFSALMEATRAYTADAFDALATSPIPEADRAKLRSLVKSTNAQMLLWRIRHVYRQRMSLPELLGSTAQALYFRLRPIAP